MLLISQKTHWSEADILALPEARFQYYLRRLALSQNDLAPYLKHLTGLTQLRDDGK